MAEDEVYVMSNANVPPYAAANPSPFANLQTPQLNGRAGEGEEHYSDKTHAVDRSPQRNVDRSPKRNVSTTLEQDQAYEQAPACSEDEEEDNYERNVVVCLSSLFLASVVVMAQASQDCENADGPCKSWSAYAIALGCVSTILSLCLLVAMRCLNPTNTERTKKHMPVCSMFLTIWWGIGVATCTFDGPFENTGNGFFACWLALFLSIYFCQITISKFGAVLLKCRAEVGNEQQRVMGMIMVMSFTEAYSCLLEMDNKTEYQTHNSSSQELWGMSCGIISGFLIIITLFLEPKIDRLNGKPGLIAYFLIPWWLFGAGVVTFDDPFTATSNGYFCAWGCFCASCYLFYKAQTERAGRIIRAVTMLGESSAPGDFPEHPKV